MIWNRKKRQQSREAELLEGIYYLIENLATEMRERANYPTTVVVQGKR